MASKSQNPTAIDSTEDTDKELFRAIKKVPSQYRAQVVALNHYLKLKKAHEETLKQKVQDIVSKYKKLRLPILNVENQLISGERELTEQELNYANRYLKLQEKESIKANAHKGEQMTDYWLAVLTNCERLNREIHDADYAALGKLKKIEHIPDDNNKYNFAIRFSFEENEFFTNEELDLRFIMSSQGDEILRIEATPINWKTGKSLTKRVAQMKQQNKKTVETRVKTTVVRNDSFFNLFKSIRPKGTEEEKDITLMEMGERHSIAIIIRDEILPYNLEYYLGVRNGAFGQPGDDESIEDKPPKKEVEKPKEKKYSKKKAQEDKKEEKKEDKIKKATAKEETQENEEQPKKGGCGVQ